MYRVKITLDTIIKLSFEFLVSCLYGHFFSCATESIGVAHRYIAWYTILEPDSKWIQFSIQNRYIYVRIKTVNTDTQTFYLPNIWYGKTIRNAHRVSKHHCRQACTFISPTLKRTKSVFVLFYSNHILIWPPASLSAHEFLYARRRNTENVLTCR